MGARGLSHRRLVFAVLLAASMLSIASGDLYVPSLPDLPAYFGTSQSLVQMTVSLNVLAFALAQFVHGPLADRYGSRRVLLGAMGLFSLASLACAGARDIDQLLWARVFQGLVAAAEGVVVMAVIRELFDERDRVRALALFGMLWALAPAVAPVIGGYVHVWMGWQANFVGLAVGGVIVTALIWRYMPVVGATDPTALQPRRVYRAYRDLATNRAFVGYSLLSGCCLGVIFAFVTVGPFILVDRLGVPLQRYAWHQGAQVLAFSLGSLLAGRVAGRYSPDRIMGLALALATVAALLLLGLDLVGGLGPWTLTAVVAVIFFAAGPIFAAAPARAMAVAVGGGGVTAAGLGGLEMLGGAIGSLLVTLLGDGGIRSLSLAMAGVIFAAWVLRWIAMSGASRRTSRSG